MLVSIRMPIWLIREAEEKSMAPEDFLIELLNIPLETESDPYRRLRELFRDALIASKTAD